METIFAILTVIVYILLALVGLVALVDQHLLFHLVVPADLEAL